MEPNDKDKEKYKEKITEENKTINDNSIEVVRVSPFRNCDILNFIYLR